MKFFNKILGCLVLILCLGVGQGFGASNAPAAPSGLYGLAEMLWNGAKVFGNAAVDTGEAIKKNIFDPTVKAAGEMAEAGLEKAKEWNAGDKIKLDALRTNKATLESGLEPLKEALTKPDIADSDTKVVSSLGALKLYVIDKIDKTKPVIDSYLGNGGKAYKKKFKYWEIPKPEDECGYLYNKERVQQAVQQIQVGLLGVTDEIKDLEEEMETAHKKKLEDIKKGGMLGKVGEMFGKTSEKREEAKGRASVAREYATAIKEWLGSPKNIAMIVAAIIIVIAAYKGIQFASDWAERNMGRPSLVLEDDNKTFKEKFLQNLKAVFSGDDEDEEEKDILSGVVLSDEMQDNIRTYAEDICQNRQIGLPYQNALFYGPPGTGKTMVAKLIARGANVHYVLTSGANISQFRNGQAVAELNKIFEYAEARFKKTGVPTLIFFDEADCFRDRALQDKDGVDTVNAFLARTNGCNEAYIVILATNAAEDVDTAVLSRAPKKFKFSLPGPDERFKMLMNKLETFIFNDSRTYTSPDGDEIEASLIVDSKLDVAFWHEVTKLIDGFSGRDIEMLVQEMRTRAYRSGANVVTKEIVDKVVKDSALRVAADKRKAEYQRQKFAREKGMDRYDESADLVTSAASLK